MQLVLQFWLNNILNFYWLYIHYLSWCKLQIVRSGFCEPNNALTCVDNST